MISDLIGTPFVGQGRNPKTGLDCYGLVQEVFRRYGYTIPEYYDSWNDNAGCHKFYRESQGMWEKVENLKELQPPVLIAFSFGDVPYGVVNHSGVYIGNGRFIHTRPRINCCIERTDSIAWKRLIVGYYRYKGEKNDNISNCSKPNRSE